MKSPEPFRIAELIFRELNGELSEAESVVLGKWKNEDPENLALYKKIVDENNIREKIRAYQQTDTEGVWSRLEKKLKSKKKPESRKLVTRIPWAVAASLILLLGSYLLIRLLSAPEAETRRENHTILAGTQKAILITSDNQQIALGELHESKTFSLANALVKDTNNTLTYQNLDTELTDAAAQVAMNTLETPAGGEYSLVLSDGTRVFLNAKTRLSFPEVFSSDRREVSLEGEAYFEVAKSQIRSFIVKTANYDIRVYGTSFNVSAYSSDNSNHTTLVEGSVGISTAKGTEIRLVPGEQALFDRNDQSLTTKRVDPHVYTAWKEGKFVFDNESLDDIMRKLGRWYNTETMYQSSEISNRHFSGTLDRYDEITDVLDMIALTTHIEFKVEGNTIIVNDKE